MKRKIFKKKPASTPITPFEFPTIPPIGADQPWNRPQPQPRKIQTPLKIKLKDRSAPWKIHEPRSRVARAREVKDSTGPAWRRPYVPGILRRERRGALCRLSFFFFALPSIQLPRHDTFLMRPEKRVRFAVAVGDEVQRGIWWDELRMILSVLFFFCIFIVYNFTRPGESELQLIL